MRGRRQQNAYTSRTRYISIRKRSTSQTTRFISETKAKQIKVFMVQAAYHVVTRFIFTCLNALFGREAFKGPIPRATKSHIVMQVFTLRCFLLLFYLSLLRSCAFLRKNRLPAIYNFNFGIFFLKQEILDMSEMFHGTWC